MTQPSTEPERLDLRSHDIAADKREELLRLFPEARTEDGLIDFDQLRRVLGDVVDAGRERYGMTWPGKADCFKAIQQPSLGTLLPNREESVDFDTPENLIIEGDNLEVLKLLQKSYLGKVKMIYIDPPYNTGNDFIYPDDYSESLRTYLEYTGQVDAEGRRFGTNPDTAGRFHSRWLSMMYPRLYLAQNLLRDDGFIVVSIDDTEISNLRAVLNETFGEENFIAVLVFDRNRKNDAKLFSVGHEYMVVYARNRGLLTELDLRLRAPKEGVDEVRELFDRLRGQYDDDWTLVARGLRDFYTTFDDDDPRMPLTRFTKVDERGPFRTDGNPSWPGGGGPRYDVPHPVTGAPCRVPSRGWVWSTYERMKEEIERGNIVFGADESTIPGVRMNLFEMDDQVMRSVTFSYAQKASQDFARIFDGVKVFDNPKSYIDLERIISYLVPPGELVLDFFAGSGTAAHGTLLANRAGGQPRRFICVQLPEPIDAGKETGRNALSLGLPTISAICRERVRRVIKAMDEEDEPRSPGVPKQLRGFRAFKLAQSNFLAWNADIPQGDVATLERQLNMHVDHTRDGRTAEDQLYEILLKSGFPLTTLVETLLIEGKTVFSVAEGEMLVCLDGELTLEAIRAMAARSPSRVVCLDEGFAGNDQLKANAAQLMKDRDIVFKTV